MFSVRCRDLLHPVRLPGLLREGRTEFPATGQVPRHHQPHLQEHDASGAGRHHLSGKETETPEENK
jgi:hypothetical protein